MSFWGNRPQISGPLLFPGGFKDLTFGQQRAFVVLIGWIGATDKQLLKFVALYKNLG